jgi:cell division protein FtsB
MPKLGLSFYSLVVVIILSVIVIQNDLIRYYSLLEKNNKTAGDIILEGRRNKELKRELGDLKKNDRIEVIARSKLLLVKKGEKPYKIIP